MYFQNDFYAQQNQQSREKFAQMLTRVSVIKNNLQSSTCEYDNFFYQIASLIEKTSLLEKKLVPDYFKTTSFEALKAENYSFYEELIGDTYASSLANPAYCVARFGEKTGQLFSYFYIQFRHFVKFAYQHKVFFMSLFTEKFLELFDFYSANGFVYEEFLKIMTAIDRSNDPFLKDAFFNERYNPDFTFFKEIIQTEDLSDLRYLFCYGDYISDNEIKTAQFLNKYPEEKAQKLMKQTAKAYISSFVESGKDYQKKKVVGLVTTIGMEKLTQILMQEMEAYGLKPVIDRMQTSDMNKQYPYDHRFDLALYYDAEYCQSYLKEYGESIQRNRETISGMSGSIYYDMFGTQPFDPEAKKECLKLSEAQLKLKKDTGNKSTQMFYEVYNRNETSFCIIGFPVPEIGDKFEDIFDATMEINLLDHDNYLVIQQKIIDILDEADYVEIKGQGNNITDLQIKIQPLKNPAKETNFCNCGATVNIPVGEVFTSPQLKGTNGTLFISDTYLGSLKYLNLKLDFKDGNICDYNCSNFDTEIENKKYIEENLIFPHKTLPIGEFAIGTNTLAYVVAKKFDILPLLPVLIIEKMGPHFAIGDTCYSWEEDTVVYNPNKKQIMSRDNERSILRKTNINDAYTQCHTDITLPYEEIGNITVVTPTGERKDIIRNGRFVVPGTEELNKPFE